MNIAQLKERIKNISFLKKKRLQSKVPLRFPFLLNIELTNICTERCIWCPQDEITRPKGFIDVGLFKKIIDECARYERLRRLYVHWMGEPLLHPKIVEMLEYAKKKNIAEMIVIATNGTHLSEKIMKELIRLEIDELYLSIDAGTEDTYKRLKGTKSFNKIESNIRNAMELKKKLHAKLPYLRLKYLDMDQNNHEIGLFKRKWETIVDTIFFEDDFNIWNGASNRVNESVVHTDAYKRNYGNLDERYPCDRLWYMLAIHWDGKVSPCVCDWDGKTIVGDLASSSLREIWYSEKMREFRGNHLNNEFDRIEMCKVCTRWGTRNMGDWLTKHKEKALLLPS
jgi:radical SAM protein with 4Fe4S-binding SPASM domain